MEEAEDDDQIEESGVIEEETPMKVNEQELANLYRSRSAPKIEYSQQPQLNLS